MPDALAGAVPLLKHRALGAQVLQACLGDVAAIFYLSPLCLGAMAAVPARGGVPVLFPQFADTGLLPKHGLVRIAQWELLEEQMAKGSHSLRYGLEIFQDDYSTWPHAVKLNLVAVVTPEAVFFELKVVNTGLSSFSWTGGLHPYFALQDVLQSSLSGLGGLGVQDRYDRDVLRQSQGDVRWNHQPFERLYAECPTLTLNTGNYSLRLSASGFDQWMVWNPGEEGGNALADLPAGDWRHFVCVEPVCVVRPVLLAPGETFEGSLRIIKC